VKEYLLSGYACEESDEFSLERLALRGNFRT